ncbi:MAG: DUF1178 family protein [Burkholderiales bacterium]|nr:DUF1178 family protein [Burkholderiales bacterium]
MIVFDLACESGHRFEGWFGSTGDFEAQRGRGMLECPVCGIQAVSKLLSAPRLNLVSTGMADPGAEAGAKAVAVPDEAGTRATMVAARTAFYQHLRQMLERSDDVGERFAEEARRIHYKETPERQIHGVATREETAELIDEGVAVLPLPFTIKRKGELN